MALTVLGIVKVESRPHDDCYRIRLKNGREPDIDVAVSIYNDDLEAIRDGNLELLVGKWLACEVGKILRALRRGEDVRFPIELEEVN
jgi:hypothetical protein